MSNSTPHTKTALSAATGVAVATLVIGGALYGGAAIATLRGHDVQSSRLARAAFAVPRAPHLTVQRAHRDASATTAQPATPITYRVAELAPSDGESQGD